MTKRVIIAPSILAADFSRLGEQVKQIEDAGAQWLHIDVMDGHFVPNLTMGPVLLKGLRKKSKLFFDVHLMIENPEKYVEPFVKEGAELISFHSETMQDTDKLIDKIHSLGIKAGIAVKPKTDLNKIIPFLPKLDLVIVMTVEPGFAGQAFMPEVLPKLKELRKIVDEKKYKITIQVDGGVDASNAAMIVRAGADCLVAGAAVFAKPDPGQAVKELFETIV